MDFRRKHRFLRIEDCFKFHAMTLQLPPERFSAVEYFSFLNDRALLMLWH